MQRRVELTAALATLCLCSIFMVAQTEDPIAIRVESNLVVLHVALVDKVAMHKFSDKYQQCALSLQAKFQSLSPSQPYLPGDCSDWMVYGLGVADFHVFEDGVEQKVQSATLEPDTTIVARDNLGWHDEWSHTPRGKWSTIDRFGLAEQTLQIYSLSYVPPRPAEGKCHNVEVRVDRPDTLVFAPNRYCYVSRPSTDPLLGTDTGIRLESDLTSEKRSKIPLLSQATYTLSGDGNVRVDIVLEFPWHRLSHRWVDGDMKATIGVLGIVYDEKHSIITRFSDTANAGVLEGMHVGAISGIDYDESTGNYLPSRYETQIDLPAGKFDLRIILGDGKKFGLVDIPLAIDNYGNQELALSSVVLFKRFRPAEVAAQEAAAVNLAPDLHPLVSQGIQITPAADTSFDGKEPIPLYFEVYDPLISKRPDIRVKAHLRIVSKKNGASYDLPWFDSEEFRRAGTTTFEITRKVTVEGLSKGEYQIEVQAADSAGRITPWRAAPFTLK